MVSGRSRETAVLKVDPELMMTAGPVSSDLPLIFCSLIPVSKSYRTPLEIEANKETNEVKVTI